MRRFLVLLLIMKTTSALASPTAGYDPFDTDKYREHIEFIEKSIHVTPPGFISQNPSEQAPLKITPPTDVERNRKIIIEKHLSKYKAYASCMVQASEYFNVPEWLIYAIVYHERGPIGGALDNRDKTKDHGPTGINDKRLIDYRDMGVKLTAYDIQQNPCVGIRMTGHLVRKEYDKLRGSKQNWMTAVGNYHYNLNGRYPHNHYKYKQHIRDALTMFKRTIDSTTTQ